MAERDVARRGRQARRRNRVLDPDGDLVLAAPWDRPVREQVCQQDVHPVRTEGIVHRGEDASHPVRVALIPVLGRVEQLRCVSEPSWWHERDACHECCLGAVSRGDLHEPSVPGWPDPGNDGRSDGGEQLPERLQTDGGVMVPGDDHHGDPRLVQLDERLEHQRVGLGGRGPVVVDVAGHQDGVDPLLHGDADHLAEGVLELGEA